MIRVIETVAASALISSCAIAAGLWVIQLVLRLRGQDVKVSEFLILLDSSTTLRTAASFSRWPALLDTLLRTSMPTRSSRILGIICLTAMIFAISFVVSFYYAWQVAFINDEHYEWLRRQVDSERMISQLRDATRFFTEISVIQSTGVSILSAVVAWLCLNTRDDSTARGSEQNVPSNILFRFLERIAVAILSLAFYGLLIILTFTPSLLLSATQVREPPDIWADDDGLTRALLPILLWLPGLLCLACIWIPISVIRFGPALFSFVFLSGSAHARQLLASLISASTRPEEPAINAGLRMLFGIIALLGGIVTALPLLK